MFGFGWAQNLKLEILPGKIRDYSGRMANFAV